MAQTISLTVDLNLELHDDAQRGLHPAAAEMLLDALHDVDRDGRLAILRPGQEPITRTQEALNLTTRIRRSGSSYWTARDTLNQFDASLRSATDHRRNPRRIAAETLILHALRTHGPMNTGEVTEVTNTALQHQGHAPYVHRSIRMTLLSLEEEGRIAGEIQNLGADGRTTRWTITQTGET